MIRLIFILALLSFCVQGLFSQEEEKSLDSLFADGLRASSEPRTSVFLGITDLIHGGIPISIEQRFSKRIGAEVGIGLLLPYYIPELLLGEGFLEDSTEAKRRDLIPNPHWGSSFSASIKYIIPSSSSVASNISLNYRKRNFNLEAGEIEHRDLRVLGEVSIVMRKNWLFIYSGGIGLRWWEDNTSKNYQGLEDGLTFPIGLRVGRILK